VGRERKEEEEFSEEKEVVKPKKIRRHTRDFSQPNKTKVCEMRRGKRGDFEFQSQFD
jgi:hypothetical protein